MKSGWDKVLPSEIYWNVNNTGDDTLPVHRFDIVSPRKKRADPKGLPAPSLNPEKR